MFPPSRKLAIYVTNFQPSFVCLDLVEELYFLNTLIDQLYFSTKPWELNMCAWLAIFARSRENLK